MATQTIYAVHGDFFMLPGYWWALAPDFCPHHWRKSYQVFQTPNTPVIRTERPKFSNKDSIFILFVCYIHPSFPLIRRRHLLPMKAGHLSSQIRTTLQGLHAKYKKDEYSFIFYFIFSYVFCVLKKCIYIHVYEHRIHTSFHIYEDKINLFCMTV